MTLDRPSATDSPVELPRTGRRSFLSGLAGLGLASKARKPKDDAETLYRFLTPECEVTMSVQFFPSARAHGFRFRDRLTNRAFCLSADGEENRDCLQGFAGSLAIARYDFRSRLDSRLPLHLRERVRTIDYDGRMAPRPPFERTQPVEKGVVSDIQAFGHDPSAQDQSAQRPASLALWCLVRQDLYLNEQPGAFLIVHWKHTFDAITLVDVIPGDSTVSVTG
jgi:hypothetical protein